MSRAMVRFELNAAELLLRLVIGAVHVWRRLAGAPADLARVARSDRRVTTG